MSEERNYESNPIEAKITIELSVFENIPKPVLLNAISSVQNELEEFIINILGDAIPEDIGINLAEAKITE